MIVAISFRSYDTSDSTIFYTYMYRNKSPIFPGARFFPPLWLTQRGIMHVICVVKRNSRIEKTVESETEIWITTPIIILFSDLAVIAPFCDNVSRVHISTQVSPWHTLLGNTGSFYFSLYVLIHARKELKLHTAIAAGLSDCLWSRSATPPSRAHKAAVETKTEQQDLLLYDLRFVMRVWTYPKGDVTRDDSQRRFLVQHSVAALEQCCNYSKQCSNNVATLCCAKNRRYESSRVASP